MLLEIANLEVRIKISKLKMNDKKKKRKAQNSSEDENEDHFDTDYSPSKNPRLATQRIMRETTQFNHNNSQIPNGLVEKRKKVSQQFDDLARLNDLESTQVSHGFD